MSNLSDIGAVQVYSGATSGANAVPTSYPASSSTFYAGASSNLALWVKFTTGATSNFTGYSIKLQGSYDGTNYVDLLKTDNLTSGTTNIEHTVAGLSANTTYWAVFMTSNARMCTSLRILFKGNGGAVSADDTLTVYALAK